MPAVSVIIPTYQHRDYVLAALASVFAQTFTDYEVIVVNDGSPDDTAARLRPLADAGRIRYVEQPNAGQAAARNRGLAEAGGEFVAFLDDDDLWPPDKLAWQVELLRADPGVCLVAGSARVFQGNDEEICHWNREDADLTPARLCASNPMTSPGQTLIRRSALAAVGGLREEVWGADDWDLYFRLARQGRLVLRDRTALHYRVHAGNASRQSGRMVGNALRVLRENVPAESPGERRRLERTGTRTLFRNYAPLLVSQWKEALRRGEWRRAGESLRTLGQFWRLWVAEPRQFIGLLALFLPVRLHATFSDPERGWKAAGENNFNLLRLLLAAVVIYSHAPPVLLGLDHLDLVGTLLHRQHDQQGEHAIDSGHMAVYAFFVISGFLISMSWSRTGNLASFLRKRVLRIYPAFVVSTACVVLLFAPLGAANASAYWTELGRHFLPVLGDTFNLMPRWHEPPFTETLVTNPYPHVVNASTWTIRYEFLCYLLVACLGVASGRVRRLIPPSFYRTAPALLFLGIYTLYIGRLHGHFGRWDALEQNPYTGWLFSGGNNIPRLFVYFAAGVCFYAYRRRLWFNTPWLLAAVGLLAASAAVPGVLPFTLPMLGSYVLMALVFAPGLRFHGFGTRQDLSYGVYLYGFPIQQLLVMYLGSRLTPTTELLAALPLAFGCAWLSWNLIEKPALSLKGRASHAPASTAPATRT